MALRTSTQSGPWSDTATWGGNPPPGIGDTFDTAGFAIEIVDGDDITTGTSGPTGTLAGTISNGGKLWALTTTGFTFRVRGDVIMAQTSTTRVVGFYAIDFQGPGIVLEFDASQATTPLSQTYVIGPSGNNQPNSRIRIAGTLGSRAQVRSNVGGGAARISTRGFTTRLNSLVATDCVFTRFGDASNPLLSHGYTSGGTEPDGLTLARSLFDTCGGIGGSANLGSNTVVSISDCKWINSPGTWNVNLLGTNAIGTGTRSIVFNALDKLLGDAASPGQWAGFTIDDNCLEGNLGSSYNVANMASFQRNYLARAVASPVNSPLVKDNIVHSPSTSTINCKLCNASLLYDQVFDGNLWQVDSTDPTGDFVSLTGTPAATRTITGQRNLVLRSQLALTERPGTLFSVASASSNWKIDAQHNTWITGTEPCVSIGETAAATGTGSKYLANIAGYYGATAGGLGPFHINDIAAGGTPATDFFAAADCDYNAAMPGVSAGSEGKGYDITVTGSPGAHDLYGVNPQYADPTRTLGTWDASLGGPGTSAGAVARFRADPTLIDVCRKWIFEGFRPTNPLYANATYPGDIATTDAAGHPLAGTIGAMAYLQTSTSSPAALLMGF